MKKYTISSGGITVTFTADQIKPSQRKRLVSELSGLCDAEELTTREFLDHHSLTVGPFTLLPEVYHTVVELARASDNDLLTIRNFGQRRLYFLREALRKEGY